MSRAYSKKKEKSDYEYELDMSLVIAPTIGYVIILLCIVYYIFTNEFGIGEIYIHTWSVFGIMCSISVCLMFCILIVGRKYKKLGNMLPEKQYFSEFMFYVIVLTFTCFMLIIERTTGTYIVRLNSAIWLSLIIGMILCLIPSIIYSEKRNLVHFIVSFSFACCGIIIAMFFVGYFEVI